MGDDLDEDLIKMKEEDDMMKDEKKKKELHELRRKGEVGDNIRLRKHLRKGQESKYNVILSSEDEWEEKKSKDRAQARS